MLGLLRAEFREIGSFLRRNGTVTSVLCLATLFLTLDRYRSLGPEWVDSLVYFAALPILAIVLFLRRNPLDFGLRLGDVRIWGLHVGAVILVGVPVLFAASRTADVAVYYVLGDVHPVIYVLRTAAILFAWEFIFRGFLLFGLRERLGEASILVQMVPFALLHLGKPEIETISTIVTGIYFGYVVYRSRSYWPAFIMHMFIDLTTRLFVNLA